MNRIISTVLMLLCLSLPAAAELDQRGYDVTHYELSFDIGDSTITGLVTIEGKAITGGLEELIFDLVTELTVDEVSSSSHAIISQAHEDNQLTLGLEPALQIDEQFAVTIAYHGEPAAPSGEFSADPFTFTTHGSAEQGTLAPVIFSMSVTNHSSAWWPCKDEIFDKATVDLYVTIPDSLVAVSNGVLLGSEPAPGDRMTNHWSHGYQVAPYLISLAISNYALIEDSAEITVGEDVVSVPLTYYVFPEDEADARIDLTRMEEMMQYLSSLFGPYPYWNEKYAMAFVPVRGGMEHQTCTTLGAYYITGDQSNEWVYVHELAHQWAGDWVGIGDWRDVWLNEAVATYCEALWVEHTEGQAAYFDYMDELDFSRPPNLSGFGGTIYDPVPLFGKTPYYKGAWLLHMLRRISGNDHFFTILRSWFDRHGDGDVVFGSDFISLCEEVTSLDLSDFFDQWLYYEGRPLYEYHWGFSPKDAGYEVVLRVIQTQDQKDVYRMPLDIKIVTTAGEQTFTVLNDKRNQEFLFTTEAKPTQLIFDPDNWILKPTFPPDPISAALYEPKPNPFHESSMISFNLPEETDISLWIFDLNGRRVRTLVDDRTLSGEHVYDWDGRDDAGNAVPSGVYYLQLLRSGVAEHKRLVLMR